MTLLLGNALPSFGTWDGVEPRPTTRPAIRKARRTFRNWNQSHRETRRCPRAGSWESDRSRAGYTYTRLRTTTDQPPIVVPLLMLVP